MAAITRKWRRATRVAARRLTLDSGPAALLAEARRQETLAAEYRRNAVFAGAKRAEYRAAYLHGRLLDLMGG